MVELADTKDLKSFGLYPYRFEPGQRHQKIGIFPVFYFAFYTKYCIKREILCRFIKC